MDDLQQRIIEIALQIPGYLGYEAKERRRDVDKQTRLQLASKYDVENTHLARVARSAPMEYSAGVENLDQKLSRLIARFHTAPRGYAGWFDAAQIVEQDLDALTKFDSALAGGVPQLQAAINNIAAAIRSKQDVSNTIDACAELLDTLNTQYDQREQLLASGKKPSLDLFSNLASPLDALKAKIQPSAALTALSSLKPNDAISYNGADYIVSGKIAYNAEESKFTALLLKDAGKERWLRIGPDQDVAICDQIDLVLPDPLPDSIHYGNQSFTQSNAGTANVMVDGVGGTRRGLASFAQYRADQDRIWVEDFGTEQRAMLCQTIDPVDVKIYRR